MTSREEGSNPGPRLPPGRRVRDALAHFLRERRPRFALVVDPGGSVLAAAGTSGGADPVALASVSSAHFAANAQLASTLGEREFTSLLHQGDETSVYLLAVGEGAILIALFDDVGHGGRAVRDAGEIIAEFAEPVRELIEGDGLEEQKAISAEWIRAAEAEIERAFRERA